MKTKKNPCSFDFKVWGETFSTLFDVVRDPRCEVSHNTLWQRIYRLGRNIEVAVKKDMKRAKLHRPIKCWNEYFANRSELADDPRCEVGYAILCQNLRNGEPPERAVLRKNWHKSIVTFNDVDTRRRRKL